MKIAVLTLTRDRLAYTKHCFYRLQEFAGIEYDHYVLDQGSADGTAEWLGGYDVEILTGFIFEQSNIGIARGMNKLLDLIDNDYDVIVKIDNDCELTQPDTLRITAETALKHNAICGPWVNGLRNPPHQTTVSTDELTDMTQIGGIFMAIPATFFNDWRYPEDLPLYGGDDDTVCARARDLGMRVGYVNDLTVNHYKTTLGQVADIPWYFRRRHEDEGGPAA